MEKFKYLINVYGTVKSYKHKSVFYRFWFLIVIALIAVFILVSVLVNSYNNTKHYNNISAMFSKNMYNMRNSFDSIFAEIILETKKISENSVVKEGKENSFADGEVIDVENFLKKVHSETDFVKSIYLYYPKYDYVVSSSVIYKSAPLREFSDTDWYDAYYSGESEVFLRFYPENSVFQKCISVCREVFNSDEVIAVFNMNYDKFNIIRRNNMLMDYEISLVNDSGSVIYSTDNEKIGKDINLYKEHSDTYYMTSNNYTVNVKLANKALYQGIRVKNTNLSIIAEIPKDNIDAISGSKSSTYGIFAAMLIALIILSVFITIKFYGSFMMFFEKIPKEESKSQKTDELTDISTQISNILNKKYETESELAESLMNLQKAQSIALQSQFSPHFLFNTLQMINSIAVAEFEGDSDITKAVSLLCDILHVAMDTTEYTCKFSDELELAKKYISLQNMKYEDAFDVKFDIDDSSLDCTVTKLFLQPILENSMHHGFDAKRQKMNINIHSHITDNKLIVTVEDDGLGMTEERQKEIALSLDNKQLEKKDSIGLLNLHQRIKLICGYEYGCMIKNNGNGVTVTITFPCR